MRRTLAMIAVVVLAPASSIGQDRTFAPDGLNPLNAQADYPITGGRPLLFCGDKFIALLLVRLFNTKEGDHLDFGPALRAFRKSEITDVTVFPDWNTRVSFMKGALGLGIFDADTLTDTRAILECLN